MKVKVEGKEYNVDEVQYGMYYNIGQTTITDVSKQEYVLFGKETKGLGYSVFIDGDEVCYETFEDAYNAALEYNKQFN